jgi:hypothetical protein
MYTPSVLKAWDDSILGRTVGAVVYPDVSCISAGASRIFDIRADPFFHLHAIRYQKLF